MKDTCPLDNVSTLNKSITNTIDVITVTNPFIKYHVYAIRARIPPPFILFASHIFVRRLCISGFSTYS